MFHEVCDIFAGDFVAVGSQVGEIYNLQVWFGLWESGAWNLIAINAFNWLKIFFYDGKVTGIWYIVSNNGYSARTGIDEFRMHRGFNIF